MSCACPGRLEMSRGSTEVKYVTSGDISSDGPQNSNVTVTSTRLTSYNCSRIISQTHRRKDAASLVSNISSRIHGLKDRRRFTGCLFEP